MKYFDKTFFKFTVGFLAIVAVSLVLIAVTSAYVAEAAGVDKIVFTTPEQIIKLNTLSDAITIQTQDLNGVFPTSETLDLDFVSTSATGEFLNSSGNLVTKTMSVNTANRTFYYRDVNSGNFIITINATGRVSGNTWTASQSIQVGSGVTPGQTGEVLSASTDSSSTLSSTSSGIAPTYATVSSQFEISAGTDRLTSPGSPLSFQALVKKNNISSGPLTFAWSFGDGNVGDGALVFHSYKYPGDYAVVLNVMSGNTSAVSRLKVKVVTPNISIVDQSDYIEILNNSSYEINIFKWKIISSGKGFIFQPDTIILPQSRIKIDRVMLNMKGEIEGDTLLQNALGQIVSSTSKHLKPEDLKEISKKADQIYGETMGILDKAVTLGLVEEKTPAKISAQPLSVTPDAPSVVAKPIEEVATAVLAETILYEDSKIPSFITKLTNLIKRVFSD